MDQVHPSAAQGFAAAAEAYVRGRKTVTVPYLTHAYGCSKLP